ncbi:MAG: type II secretion system F family protein [Alcaligenaceae bacterium]|nr:type II secretion system F family protein [Alcaligenaceae bacterium]
MSSLFIYLSLSATTISLALLVYWFLMPSMKADAGKPEQLQIHRAWNLVWPWISLFVAMGKPFMSWRYRMAIEKDIIKAGRLDYLEPEHVFGMQTASALLGSVVSGWIFWQFEFSNVLIALLLVLSAVLFFYLPRYHLKQQGAQRQRLMLKQFPFFLDMITLSVEGGLNFHGALNQTHHLLPKGPLKTEISHALSDMRAGLSRHDALKAMAKRSDLEEVNHLVSSIAQSQKLGVSLGPILRAQSEQRRSERFMRAEKLALEAPVKMLFPLVSCIFPCTFIVIAFPIALKLMDATW